jgi:glutaredoxin-like YruB-family protein
MTTKKIVIYGQEDCPPCTWAKAFFKERGLAYEEHDVRNNFKALREMVGRYNSRSTPTIVVGDEVMIGFDPERLERMLGS